MATKKILITGTDTNVGKTYMSCQLINFLKSQNKKVKAFKPIESGVNSESIDNSEKSDSRKLYESLTEAQELESISMYQLPEPLSPHLAANRAKIEISVPKILEKIESLSSDCDVLLVEGAGGLLVPILNDYTFADLAKDADLLVLVVAGSKLGVINHLQLTLEVAKSRELEILPYILNEGLDEKRDLAVETNKESLALCCKDSMLASISRDSEIQWCVENPLDFFK